MKNVWDEAPERKTLSYAMLPDGWRGRFVFWRKQRQMAADLEALTVAEFQGLQRAIREKYHATKSTSLLRASTNASTTSV